MFYLRSNFFPINEKVNFSKTLDPVDTHPAINGCKTRSSSLGMLNPKIESQVIPSNPRNFQQLLKILAPFFKHFCVDFLWHFLDTFLVSNLRDTFWGTFVRTISNRTLFGTLFLRHCLSHFYFGFFFFSFLDTF